MFQRAEAGADDQDRTGDLVLTKDVLCQLSYIGSLVLGAWFVVRRRFVIVGPRVFVLNGSAFALRASARLASLTALACLAEARSHAARAKAGAGDGDRTRDQQLGRL